MKYPLTSTVSAILIFLFSLPSYSQNHSDTLQMAKQLRDGQQISAAVHLLESYYKTHPKDLNTLWLYGNTAYLNKEYSISASVYWQAVQLFPDNYFLKLDYAKILTSLGRLAEAIPLLQQCMNQEITYSEASYYLATVYYWQVKYNEASTLLSKLLVKDPENQAARVLLEKIREDRSTVVEAGIRLNTDDQPMKVLTPWVKSKAYTSKLHELQIMLDVPLFTDDTLNSHAFGLRAGNQFLIGKAGLGLYLEAGVFNNPDVDKTIFTGNIRLDKTFKGKVRISAGFERKPYYLTLTSAQQPLPENHTSFSVSLGKEEKWNMKAGVDNSSFPTDDNNNIFTAYSWVLTPVLKAGKLDFRLGYGINYSNAGQSRFISSRSLARILADTNYQGIEGVYNPYFTPHKMQVHSALGILNINISKKLIIGMKYSYGFYAVTDNPYLFIKASESGPAIDTLMIARQFARMNFNPYEFNADITYRLGRKFSVSGQFKSFKTLYYQSNLVGISFRKVL